MEAAAFPTLGHWILHAAKWLLMGVSVLCVIWFIAWLSTDNNVGISDKELHEDIESLGGISPTHYNMSGLAFLVRMLVLLLIPFGLYLYSLFLRH